MDIKKTNSAIPLLANEYVKVFESDEPSKVYGASPSICAIDSGRLISTFDIHGEDVAANTSHPGHLGYVSISDDKGATWKRIAEFPFYHARVFKAGDSLYILGHCKDLMIIRSSDDGETWSEPAKLTQGQHWHQAPCNVHYANDKVYLVMERHTDPTYDGWCVSRLAPVVMAAKEQDNLLNLNSWTFSNEICFHKDIGKPSLLGIPFYSVGFHAEPDPETYRFNAESGWLETNIVQFNDPDNIWYDPAGKTFYLWMRAHTGRTNIACIAKASEDEDGNIEVSIPSSPAGEKMAFVPCPGGQMKFHIVYDEKSKLFWLLSTLSTDSMTRPDKLESNRYNMPDNERQKLALYFSTNCFDWCMAGRVAQGETQLESRHYASMVIDGDNLCVLSRSGDAHAKTAHNGNLITFHTIKNFRDLIY